MDIYLLFTLWPLKTW